MISTDKTEFYKFLNGDTSISDFEKLIYAHSDWEKAFGEDKYFELINFDFKDKNSKARLIEFILTFIIDQGDFETWKLKTLLSNFISDVKRLPDYLEKFYDLYCGIYQESGNRKYKYKFLGNLGLNYFYWFDESFLKQHYGENWRQEDALVVNDLEFYHKQLRPYADTILAALNNGEIQIHNEGAYTISEKLRNTLEGDKIFQLEHPQRK